MKTLKEVASEMRLHPHTAGRWLKRLKHKPTVKNHSGGYRFDDDNAERFLNRWAAYCAKMKRKRTCRRKRKR